MTTSLNSEAEEQVVCIHRLNVLRGGFLCRSQVENKLVVSL